MPALVMARRRFRFGSDDLVHPSVAFVVLRFCWTSALIAYVAHVWTFLRRECASAFVVLVVVFLAAVGITSIALNVSIAVSASRGVILSAKERRGVPALIYASCVLAAFEAGASSFFMWLAWSPKSDTVCTKDLRDDTYERAGLRIIATTQCVGLCLSGLAILAATDVGGSRKVRGIREKFYAGPSLEVLKFRMDQRDWTSVCESLCACASCTTCGVFGGREFTAAERKKRGVDIFSSDIADVASILTVFLGTIDVVPTDILAGLALVRARQLAAKRAAPTRTEDEMPVSTEQGARYINYAIAMYGWKMYFATSPCKALMVAAKALAKSLVGGGCCDALDGIALRRFGGRVLFESFRAVTNELVPVTIFADDDANELIVACRGTLSLGDCVTDATARPRDALPGGRGFAHGGIVRVARGVGDLLKGPLAEALDGERAGYRIVVVGHSLGAGVAALVTLALRDTYPSTTCVAIAPPGALVDLQLAESMKSFCTSYVLGDDVVPRLGIGSIFSLRDKIVVDVVKSSKHKSYIIASIFQANPDTDALFYSPEHPDYEEAEALSQLCLEALDKDAAREEALTWTELTLPGKIVHVTRRTKDTPAARESLLSRCFRWRKKDDTTLTASLVTDKSRLAHIIVSQRMFLDHMPWVIASALQECA